MKERPIIENQIIEIIDRLKGLCHTCGLSNQAAEEEIVTSVFLYKYLSDNYKICAFKKASHTGKSIAEIFTSGIQTDVELKAEDLIHILQIFLTIHLFELHLIQIIRNLVSH